MIKQSIVKSWEFLGAIIGLYTIYDKLKTFNQAKNELYQELPPEFKEKWTKLFGAPKVEVQVQPVAKPTTEEQFKAGV